MTYNIKILLKQKLTRYFLVGSTAAFIDISIFFVFAKLLEYNYLVVSTAGFIIATLVNYLMSIRLVFQSNIRFSTRMELTLVYVVSTIGLMLNLSILYILIDLFGFEKMVSKLVATGAVFIWNFSARNFFIFRRRKLAN